MLHALQSEIVALQRRCADAQRQLVLHGILPNREELLEATVEQLSAKLNEKCQECETLKDELKTKEKMIEDTEQKLREREERYWDDISARNLIIVRLRKEVQEKASTVARLSAQLSSQPRSWETEKPGSYKSVVTPRPAWDRHSDPLSCGGAGRLCNNAMGSRAAGNSQTISLPPVSRPSSISRKILDKYCQSSQTFYAPNGNVTMRQTPLETSGTENSSLHSRVVPNLQTRKNVPERRLGRELVCNMRTWRDPQVVDGDVRSST